MFISRDYSVNRFQFRAEMSSTLANIKRLEFDSGYVLTMSERGMATAFAV